MGKSNIAAMIDAGSECEHMPVETPPHAVVPFPFDFARFNSEFGTKPAPASQQETVSHTLQRLGRAGAEQIASACGMTAYTVRKRFTELTHIWEWVE